MSVLSECCVLSLIGLCDQRNPTKCGVSECDFETSTMRFGPLGLSSHGGKIISGEHRKSGTSLSAFFICIPLYLS